MSNRKGIHHMSKQGNPEASLGAAAIGAAAATAMVMDPLLPEAPSSYSVADREEIARLAHAYWEARCCPDGSPEEDWFRAEKALREQAREAAA
jgi:Protein of unknown function (DUF2934)